MMSRIPAQSTTSFSALNFPASVLPPAQFAPSSAISQSVPEDQMVYVNMPSIQNKTPYTSFSTPNRWPGGGPLPASEQTEIQSALRRGWTHDWKGVDMPTTQLLSNPQKAATTAGAMGGLVMGLLGVLLGQTLGVVVTLGLIGAGLSGIAAFRRSHHNNQLALTMLSHGIDRYDDLPSRLKTQK